VRIIDLFVESISLVDFKFVIKTTTEGRPAYHPKDLLKLYVYGYLNHIRSSRLLEKECKRNIEMMWLMKELVPDHNTISNFRRDNEKAIRKVFRYTVSIAKEFNLIGGTLVAGDSTKLRAQNSKKNNFNESKIERHIAYIDNRLDEYNKALATADEDNKSVIEEQIKNTMAEKIIIKRCNRCCWKAANTRFGVSDPDSRQMMTRNNISEVAYHIQTVVDAKHNLPIDYKVTNHNDTRAMSGMLRRTKIILGNRSFTALYDKGYHTGAEIKKAVEMNVHTIDDPNQTMESIVNHIVTGQGGFKGITNWDDLLKQVYEHTKAGNTGREKQITVLSWRKFYRLFRKTIEKTTIFQNSVVKNKKETRLQDALKNISKNDVCVVDIAKLDEETQGFVFGDVMRAIYDLKLGQIENRKEAELRHWLLKTRVENGMAT